MSEKKVIRVREDFGFSGYLITLGDFPATPPASTAPAQTRTETSPVQAEQQENK